jgi:hypothetical protein
MRNSFMTISLDKLAPVGCDKQVTIRRFRKTADGYVRDHFDEFPGMFLV